jgi:hypothetical protein
MTQGQIPPAPPPAPAAAPFQPDRPAPPPVAGSPTVPPADPVSADTAKIRYQAMVDAALEVWKQQQANDTAWRALTAARQDADRAAETASVAAIQAAYVTSTQAALDKALTRANVVTGAVGTMVTLYTGLIALVYAADPTKGRPLTAVALVPALFLGASLVLVTVYAAMLRKRVTVDNLLPTGVGATVMRRRLAAYMTWAFTGLLNRAWAMNSGIVALGWGVASLPLPFLRLSPWANWSVLIVGLLTTAVMALVTYFSRAQEVDLGFGSQP